MFMNDFDIQDAIGRHIRNNQPNRLGAAYVIQNLAEWTDDHSDGWAYWPKPARAAAKLMELADEHRADTDVTDAELVKAASSVKAFCTRQIREGNMTTGQREQILRSVTA